MLQSYKIFLTLTLVLSASFLRAQELGSIYGDGSVEFKRQIVGGPILHTHGFGVSIAWGRRVNGFKQRMIQIDLVTLKHEKEIKTFSPYEDSKGYVYGKLNQVILINPTWGYKHVKYDKLRASGVEVGYSYGIGPSLALLKPVFLEIGYPEYPFQYTVTERYDPEIHNTLNIYGRASNLKGIEKMKMIPGVHAKFGMVFEYSPYKDGIKALEVGATLDLYPKALPIMAYINNHSSYLNFYVTLLFGKKYIQ